MASKSSPAPARWLVLLETASLVTLYVMGTLLAALVWPIFALIYLGISLVSNLVFMVLICPYCPHCQKGNCHSGYHHIAKFFQPEEGRNFAGQFRRYVKVMYPVWFIPPVLGIVLLVTEWNWPGFGMLVVFCGVGFVILPAIAQQFCKQCENAATCPRAAGRQALTA